MGYIESKMYGNGLVYNKRGDFVLYDGSSGSFSLYIPDKNSIHVKYLDSVGFALSAIFVIAGIVSILGIFTYDSHTEFLTYAGILAFIFIIGAIVFGFKTSPGSLLQPRKKRFRINRSQFPNKYVGTVEGVLLEMLDNDDVRNDLIELITVVSNDYVDVDTLSQLYSDMQEVAFSDKNVARMNIDNMADKYRCQAEGIRDISRIV